jgi:hypothetical protein
MFVQEEAETCERCGKEIKGESLGVGQLSYHASCLTCIICKENLGGKPVSLDGSGNVYCTRDYDRYCTYAKDAKGTVPRTTIDTV